MKRRSTNTSLRSRNASKRNASKWVAPSELELSTKSNERACDQHHCNAEVRHRQLPFSTRVFVVVDGIAERHTQMFWMPSAGDG